MCSFLIKAFCTRVPVKKTTPKVDRIREFLVCDFFSKQVYRLRLHCIFWDISVESLLQDKVRERTPLKVYFTFTKTIGQSLFNYGKFLKTLRIDIVKDILETDCACSSSPFLSGPCGHVVSGDLNVISKSENRDLMKR